MMSEEVLAEADDFLALRERFVSESVGAQFKTQVVGGFRQDEVKEYILQMKEDYRTLEQRMKSEINELATSKLKMERELEGAAGLKEKLASSLSECSEKALEIERLQEQICLMSEQHSEMKGIIAEAGQEIRRLMDIAEGSEVEELEQRIEMLQESKVSLEKMIKEKDVEMAELRRMVEDAARELQQEKARALSNEISGFKDEVFSIYRRIENMAGEQAKINAEIQLKLDEQIMTNSDLLQQLEGQADINNDLQEQLDAERLRATKAEADQAAYIRCICELKESLFRERAHLETQLSQIADRRDDVNGRLMSLQEFM